jgi:enterochelin esterase family protein
MQKDDNAVWKYTSGILPSELYNYNFIIDGVKTIDPANVYLTRDVSSIFNIFIIGGGQGDLYQAADVPHGSVSRCWYHSTRLGKDRRLSIYTPPGYENTKQKYPVLYLLHGAGGDEEAWLALGRSVQILDNLIAAKKAQPMIVVMTNGNVTQQAAPGEDARGFYKPSFMGGDTRMDGEFELSFPEIIDYVEAHFRVKADKAHRAICGLSMGGFHSLHISKQYPTKFDYVGLFSAAILPRDNATSEVYAKTEEKLKMQFSLKPRLYWIAIGKTDFLYDANVAFRQQLDANGYKYIYYETGEGHIWKNWRIYLSLFVPMLFQ